MTILYNCHTDGDNWRVTKFNDGEVESTYLCSTDECQCPAGHRPSCRHRLMLPMFIDRGAVNTMWFLDWERKGWVSNESRQHDVGMYIPCERSELGSQKPYDTFDYTNRSELDSQQTALKLCLIGKPGHGRTYSEKDAYLFDPEPHSPTVTTAEFDSADGSSILPAASTKPSWRRI